MRGDLVSVLGDFLVTGYTSRPTGPWILVALQRDTSAGEMERKCRGMVLDGADGAAQF